MNNSDRNKSGIVREKTCTGCGASFACGPGTGADGCWCNALPPVIPIQDGKDCLCTDCLKAAVKEKIRRFAEDFKAGRIENCAPEYAGNSKALVPDVDYTMENGLLVFTSWYLLKRGYCCERGCRNCPYRNNE